MAYPVLSTYRLQLTGSASAPFTFADAEQLVDYLDTLGVTHLYLSPVLTATPGSTHGYDVVDPTTVSSELGGADGLDRLSAAARSRGLGLIVDIVPNHVGVDQPERNRWWWDVLQHGRNSDFADFFDIDWSADNSGRIILPVLGSDSDVADLVVGGDTLRLGSLVFPIAPGTAGGSGAEVHERQHYKLTGWRTGVCGYRRFFSITSLAGLRQENPKVFDASHTEVARWFSAGLVDGVRIDHPDGLTDPSGYLVRLRELVGSQAWIVIEKILAVGEPLDPSLPINGTTGYDALREVGGLFIDPAGAGALTALVESTGYDYGTASDQVRDLKVDTATGTLSSELARLCRSIVRSTGTDDRRLGEALAALIAHIEMYRSDYLNLSAVVSTAIGDTAAANPHLDGPLQIIAAALGYPEPAARFQQLCGATTAKAVEDCYFYRDARLVALNEVGGEPQRFGVSAAEFHRSAAVRARLWPTTMTTLSTHDTKRSEDVRARIGVLSQVPDLWADFVANTQESAPPPDLSTGLFLLQNIFGVWPSDGSVTEELRDRLHDYAEKAIREAGRRTSWADPDEAFETAVHTWLDGLLDGPVGDELARLVDRLEPHAHNDSLGQKLVALTAPGIPDVYQGSERWDDSLVDPDNRRPVDYSALREELARLTHPKMRVIKAALHSRRERPASYLTGGYLPVLAEGAAAAHLVAFLRGEDVLVAVTRWTVRLRETGWKDTVLPLPPGSWVDRPTGRRWSGSVPAADLFTELPVALLEKVETTDA
jgi:(1->4)-alpha-D-glucan 1-alpha-D-glucosylmutase